MEARTTILFYALFSAVQIAWGQVNPSETVNLTDVSIQFLDSVNSSSNGTNYTVPVATASPVPPLWCPKGYRLMKIRGLWLRVCQPMSCSRPFSNATRNCAKVIPELLDCPKIYLEPHEYLLDDNDGLVDLRDNYTLGLGEYVLNSTRAIICDWTERNETQANPPNWAELPRWCMPIEVTGGFRETATGLYVNELGREVTLFEVMQDGSAHACPELDPMIYETCPERGEIPGDEIDILPNWDVQDNKNILLMAIFPLGEYMLAADGSLLFICIEVGEELSKEASYAYGVVSLFSAFCLLLALLAHMFFPTLNYHAKALLCFAFSMFVMYMTMAVRSFSGKFDSAAANLVVFSVQYIFTLAAFFWLSVLSFDLWRVFADLRGTITPGNTAGKKRVFIAKCVYAWGIPIMLCIIVISLTFSPNIQKSLYLDLQLQNISWIHDPRTMLIIFYIPITIVLLENVIFFILTIINLRKASSGTDILNKKMSRKLFRVYMKLFLVMGLCWFAEIISWFLVHRTEEEVWYITDIINCLQGVFIFLIYVFKKKTLNIIRHKMGQINSSQLNSFTSTTQDRDRKISAISMEAMHKRAAIVTSRTSSKNGSQHTQK